MKEIVELYNRIKELDNDLQLLYRNYKEDKIALVILQQAMEEISKLEKQLIQLLGEKAVIIGNVVISADQYHEYIEEKELINDI